MSKSKAEIQAARAELLAAREAIHGLETRPAEDAEYWEANRRVLRAEKAVPWWLR
ncbi:hypothetical protein [Streptosporangium sp. NPDC006007]|uniref:hypothetical protein n=1 Tax=Streptosporangium sp. NPDC006007 TaxID=3154575 RepID=UPI0033A0F51B